MGVQEARDSRARGKPASTGQEARQTVVRECRTSRCEDDMTSDRVLRASIDRRDRGRRGPIAPMITLRPDMTVGLRRRHGQVWIRSRTPPTL